MGHLRFLLLALLTTLVAGTNASAEVTRRTVYATVTSAGGGPVSDLEAGDFTVTEDGQKCEVIHAEPAREPLAIALLVDDSIAAAPHIADLRDGLLAFVRKLYVDHEIALIGYGDRPTIHAEYTHDLPKLSNAIRRLYGHPESGSYLLDAIVQTADGLRKREATRGAIVVVGSGGPEFSNQLHTDVVAAVKRSGAVFYALNIEPGVRGDELEHARIEERLSLDATAEATGGVNRFLLTSQGLSRPLTQIAAELESQYRVVYASHSAGPAARIRIGVSRAGARARATPALTQTTARIP